MSLDQDVQRALTAAMKARDAARVSALRMLRAALLEESKRGKELTDEKQADERAVAVIRRVAKQRAEAAEAYEQAGRADLAALERAEISIAEAFLPSLADASTTATWVQEAIVATGASSPRELGRVMGALMKAHRGELDARLARQLVEQELNR